MSTTINVTVDDGGLSAKNKQQITANRQAYVQRTAAERAAQQGAQQRAANRIAAGLDPDTGLPVVTGNSQDVPRVKRIDQEPAANRFGGLDIAACSTSYSSRWQEQISIVPKRASSATVITLGQTFNYETVISQIDGRILGEVLGGSLFKDRTTYTGDVTNTTLPAAWNPPFPGSWWGGAQSCDIGGATAIDENDPNYGWEGERLIERQRETLSTTLLTVDTNMFLPVGSRTGILVIALYNYVYEFYTYRQNLTRNYVTTWGAFVNTQGDNAHYIQQNVDVSFTVSSEEKNTYSLYTIKCVVVSETQAREVPTPVELSALFNLLLPLPAASETTHTNTADGQSGTFTCGGDYNTFPNTVNTITSIDSVFNFLAYAAGQSIDLASARLRRQYGIGRLSTTSHNELYWYSPAIYALLASADPVADALDASNSDYAYYASIDGSTSRAKRFVDVQSEEISDVTSYSFRATSVRPLSMSTPVQTRPLSTRLAFTSPTLEAPYVNWRTYIAWDWDAPSYCASKALELGFRPEDLRP